MRHMLLPVAVLLGLEPSFASGQSTPELAGSVEIDLLRGSISGDVCVAGLPGPVDTARFLLHRGLNVKRIRGGAGASLPYGVEPDPHGVGLRYTVRGSGTGSGPAGAAAGRPICVEYTGAFPVFDVAAGDFASGDGSGVIAFNGQTLRARGEARWYPVPYDAETDQAQEAVTFRLGVRCDSCAQLYVNGAAPQPGPEAIFVSTEPREVVIVAGTFPVRFVDGMHFLGEEVTPDTARLFARQISEITNFYERFLGVPYGRGIDYVRVIPVRLDRPFQMWGFFSDPLLGVTGVSIADFVQILGDSAHPAREARPHLLGFLAHELAHRYFSGPLRGEYAQLFSEPFANYLGLKATREFADEAAYREGVQALHQQVIQGPDLPPLDQADPGTVGTDPYRYRYVPLLLLALEQEVGEEQLRRVLHALLTAPPAEQARADYAFLRRTALRAGVSHRAWERWENDCMRPPISQNRCLRNLLDPP